MLTPRWYRWASEMEAVPCAPDDPRREFCVQDVENVRFRLNMDTRRWEHDPQTPRRARLLRGLANGLIQVGQLVGGRHA